MSRIIGQAFVFAAATAPVLGEVVTLTPENFDEVARSGNCLVKFYAPWCGHCKTLAPEYEKASENVAEGVKLAEMDCDNADNKPICSEFEIQGFPTLKWFGKGGSVDEYDGGRTQPAIEQWIEDIQKPAVSEVDAMPEAAARLQVVLSAAEISEDFENVANKNRKHADFRFLKSDSEASVTILKSGDEPIVLDAVDSQTVTSAVDEHRFPYFGELNGETYGEYMKREGKQMLWVLLKHEAGEMDAAVDAVKSGIEELAKDKKAYSFVYTDTVQFAGAIDGMLGVQSFPAVVVQDGKKKFVQQLDAVDKDAIEKFVNGIESGEITPTVKSEDVPESQPNDVLTVVAKSLKDELFKSDRDMLLKVYAPWCGHCKTMAPHFDEAAGLLKSLDLSSKVALGKLDGTLNDSTVDGLEWSGFPTLVYVKAGTEEIVTYDGPRTKEGILAWIGSNSDQEDLKVLTEEFVTAEFEKKDTAGEDDPDDEEEGDKEEL